MKYCDNCDGIFDDDKYRCPDCDSILKKADETAEKKFIKKNKRKTDISLGLAPALWEYILSGILIAEAVVFLLLGLQTKLDYALYGGLDVLVSLACIFKGFLFRHFTWESFIAKIKGLDINLIYPTTHYKLGQKIVLVLWTAYSTFLCLYFVSLCLG